MTKNVAHAHRFDRIRVNGINLGWTRTEGEDEIQHQFHDAADDWAERTADEQPMGQMVDPDEVARLVVLLLSPDSGVVTGSIINWDQHARPRPADRPTLSLQWCAWSPDQFWPR